MDNDAIARLLRTFPESDLTGPASLRETHISWVILCGEFAYKIKKPVNFGFLNFSSLELRHYYCEQELRLNRRFSPELYLAVVAITQGGQGPQIEGDGPILDYAVKMRRFKEAQLLDGIAAQGGLTNTVLRALAREMARLHEELPSCNPNPESDAPGTPAALREAMAQNFQQVLNYALPDAQIRQLDDIQRWSQRRYEALLPVMVQRLRDGKVVDGHGDAHLGNIALVDDAVRLFDCIEFNPSFRIMDSISEIAFLAMDMDARGYHSASHRLLTDYLEYSGDYPGLPVIDLYCCYFAMVRAKVCLLREPLKDTDITCTSGYSEFLRYLDLAQSFTQPRPIFLSITHGVSGSGKSTIAGSLAEASGAVRLRSDVERKRLAGMAPEQRSESQQQAALYSSAMTRNTFARLEALATMVVEAGFSVIVDATFLHIRSRQSFQSLARELSVPYVIIDCSVPLGQLRQRLIARARSAQDASEADVAVMERQLNSAQALTQKEQAYRLGVGSAAEEATLWIRFQAKIAEPSSAPA